MLITALALTSASASLWGMNSTATNPFDNVNFYVNPSYQKELDTSISTATGVVKTTLSSMREIPSAYWLDVKTKITGTGTDSLQGILTDAAAKASPPLCVFIVYDLPNRDCHAKSSNGEICCTKNADGTCDYDAAGTCDEGIKEYQDEYITPLVKVLAEFQDKVPIALVIEPDSLPNLATNMADPHCGNSATEAAYKTGIPYAVNSIAAGAPKIPLYLDAAHGGWLGWENNIGAFVTSLVDLNIVTKLRGFSTNVANYQPIGVQCPELEYW